MMIAELPDATRSDHALDLALALPVRPRFDVLQARFEQLRQRADALIASLGDDAVVAPVHRDNDARALPVPPAPKEKTATRMNAAAEFNAGADAAFKAKAEAQFRAEAETRAKAQAGARKQA